MSDTLLLITELESATGYNLACYEVPDREHGTMLLNPRRHGELRPPSPASQPTTFADHIKPLFQAPRRRQPSPPPPPPRQTLRPPWKAPSPHPAEERSWNDLTNKRCR